MDEIAILLSFYWGRKTGAKHCRKITLRVIVDQQDLFVFVCKSSSKIQCCCSLTNTTLRVGDRYYSVFPHIYYS